MSWKTLFANPRHKYGANPRERIRTTVGDLRIGDTVLWMGYPVVVAKLESAGGGLRNVKFVADDMKGAIRGQMPKWQKVTVLR